MMIVRTFLLLLVIYLTKVYFYNFTAECPRNVPYSKEEKKIFVNESRELSMYTGGIISKPTQTQLPW